MAHLANSNDRAKVDKSVVAGKNLLGTYAVVRKGAHNLRDAVVICTFDLSHN